MSYYDLMKIIATINLISPQGVPMGTPHLPTSFRLHTIFFPGLLSPGRMILQHSLDTPPNFGLACYPLEHPVWKNGRIMERLDGQEFLTPVTVAFPSRWNVTVSEIAKERWASVSFDPPRLRSSMSKLGQRLVSCNLLLQSQHSVRGRRCSSRTPS